MSSAATSLAALSEELRALELGLATPGAEAGRARRDEIVDQVDDYLLPRLAQIDAPLLMVVGGSTGAGKSTLVNSLVGEPVSPAGVLRPTTRAPVLVCNPADLPWFEGDRVLGGLSRTVGGPAGAGGLELAPTAALPAGLALLDSPDIDSVVDANRALARQLLAAADAWLFVTTAARYADAVPWDLLHGARDRGTALSVVLNRVPDGAQEEVAGHLRDMLAAEGLAGAELLVIAETTLIGGMLSPAALAPARRWLDGLAADAQARAGLVRRTLTGALASLPARAGEVAAAVEEQQATAARLRAAVETAYAQAVEEVDEAVRSGALLRGEVLARWQEVVGTGELTRALEAGISRLRDRLRGLLTGRRVAGEELQAAVESSVDAVVHAAADRAAERAGAAWRAEPAGRALLEGAGRLDAASSGLLAATHDEVRAWQGFVFDLVRSEGQGKRATARVASLGVNGAGLVVMLAVFLQTGGLTGAEVVVAGGTSALSQKVLEAIFGDQAVRALAGQAREELLARVERLLAAEAARFEARVEGRAPGPDAARRLRAAIGRLKEAAG